MKTLIRQLLQEQSDLGLHPFFKTQLSQIRSCINYHTYIPLSIKTIVSTFVSWLDDLLHGLSIVLEVRVDGRVILNEKGVCKGTQAPRL